MKFFIFFIVISISLVCKGQDDGMRITALFYNLENLFDLKDDAGNDDEFLPEGTRHWNKKKFYDKLNKIAKVLIHAGEGQPPEIIGICEVENREVIEKLCYQSPLQNFPYKFIHYESEDRRGIDVALLYNSQIFTNVFSEKVSVFFPDDTSKRSRDILYVKGVPGNGDTLHIFVNHWPSRYSGYQATEAFRIQAAKVLRSKVDSLFNMLDTVNILIMGDFNDECDNKSINESLGVNCQISEVAVCNQLYCLSTLNTFTPGTIKHNGQWQVFDHLIVSGHLLLPGSPLYLLPESLQIFMPDYLLEKDEKFTGYKPFRTFKGMSYNGGFSDHLPVMVKFFIRNLSEP